MSNNKLNICVVGTGYVGLTTGVCFAAVGHSITCIDKDSLKIENLKQGRIPIYEPGMEELLNSARHNICFTTSYEACGNADVILLAVGTPPAADGSANLSFVEAATAEIAANLGSAKLQVIVNKSTVPIGTAQRTKAIIEKILKEMGKKADYAIASNPEFLREGMAINDTLYPDRVVLGTGHPAVLELMKDVYAPILDQTFQQPAICPRPKEYQLPVLVSTDVTSAEMIKYAANAFLATKISFINEIAGLCEKVGADVTQVAHGIGLDKRIGGRFLQAGVGWGGSCFGKDTAAIITTGKEYSHDMPIISAAIEVNKRQRSIVIEKLQENLKIIRGRTIGVLGLAFKPDTDDLRDAPALDIISVLLTMGAKVKACDPIAVDNCKKQYPELGVDYYEDPVAAAADCDAVVLVTDWNEYRKLPLDEIAKVMEASKLFIDGRNIIDRKEAALAGLTYVGFGR